ncbi:aegerolysin type hemolysin [Apiospora arundinis]
MAYGQWVYMVISNQTKSGSLKIKKLNLSCGKLYEWDNKDTGKEVKDVENQIIKPLGKMGIASCGRSDAAMGTEGSYEIWDGEDRVCKVNWSCPWSGSNKLTILEVDDSRYAAQSEGANLGSGALGHVTIKVSRLA